MINEVRKYLGNNDALDHEIEKMIKIVKDKVTPKYLYALKKTSEVLENLTSKAYKDFLANSTECLLVAISLGAEADRLINYYQKVDPLKALIADAVCNAYIEEFAFEYEKKLPNINSYRFCPGYQGTSIQDNVYILNELDAFNKLRISLTDSGLMIPLKTMAGIISMGETKTKTCANCPIEECDFIRRGLKCYKN